MNELITSLFRRHFLGGGASSSGHPPGSRLLPSKWTEECDPNPLALELACVRICCHSIIFNLFASFFFLHCSAIGAAHFALYFARLPPMVQSFGRAIMCTLAALPRAS